MSVGNERVSSRASKQDLIVLIRLLSNGSGSDEQGDEPGDELLLTTDSEDELLSDGKDKFSLDTFVRRSTPCLGFSLLSWLAQEAASLSLTLTRACVRKRTWWRALARTSRTRSWCCLRTMGKASRSRLEAPTFRALALSNYKQDQGSQFQLTRARTRRRETSMPVTTERCLQSAPGEGSLRRLPGCHHL